MKHIVRYITLFLLTHQLNGQKAMTMLSQPTIVVGEKTTLTYSIPITKGSTIVFNPYKKDLPHLIVDKKGNSQKSTSSSIEVLVPFKDTVLDDKVWIGMYEIIAWDSGQFLIEGPEIKLDNDQFIFPGITLSVDLVKAKKGKKIYGIKESFATLPAQKFSFTEFVKNNWPWFLAVLSLVGLLLFFRWYKRRINKTEEKPLTLEESTLLAIEQLEKEQYWEKGMLKSYYVALSYILRNYLSQRFSVNLLEKTSFETHLLLKQMDLDKEILQKIEIILTASDLVKFAQSQPDVQAMKKIANTARQIVLSTRPKIIHDAE